MELKSIKSLAIAIVLFVVGSKVLQLLPLPAESSSQEPQLGKDQVFPAALQKQKEFCQSGESYRNYANVQLAHANFMDTRFDMYVYAKSDTVSECILKFGAWENSETKAFYDAIAAYMERKGLTDPRMLTVLDIGAQVGWYSLGLAAKGFHVVAFEPLASNLYLLRKSFCLNQNLDLIVVDKALGPEEERCYLYSDKRNVGDPGMFCGRPSPNPNFVLTETVDVYRLDGFADRLQNLIAIKLDIEGFEHNVMRSGRRVMLEMHVPLIMSEFAADMMREKLGNPREYLEEFERAGYKISLVDFGKSLLTVDEVMKESMSNPIMSLYLIHGSAM